MKLTLLKYRQRLNKFTLFVLAALTLLPFQLSAETITTYFQVGSAPKYYYEYGQPQGICVDYINAINQILKDEGSEIKIISEANVARIKVDLEVGGIDLYFGLTKTAEREKIYDYLEPILTIQYAFATHKDVAIDFANQNDLQGLTIGVISGARSSSFIEEQYQNFKTVVLNSPDNAIKLLAAKRIDAIFYHDLGLKYQIKSNNLGDNIIVSPSSSPPRFQYAVLSKNIKPEKKAELKKAFEILKSTKVQQNILLDYGNFSNFYKLMNNKF